MGDRVDPEVWTDIENASCSGSAPRSDAGEVRTLVPRLESANAEPIGTYVEIELVDQHDPDKVRPTPERDLPPRQDVIAPFRGLSHRMR